MPDWRVDAGKILHDVLNDQSPSGVAKAKFFLSRGFKREDWEGFRDALIVHARTARLEELDLTSPLRCQAHIRLQHRHARRAFALHPHGLAATRWRSLAGDSLSIRVTA
jgi:hypothetical protein